MYGIGPSSDINYYNIYNGSTRYNLVNNTIFGKCPEVGGNNTYAAEHWILGDYGFNSEYVVWAGDKAIRLSRFKKPSTTLFCVDAVDLVHQRTTWYAVIV